eukprot:TRINITY_DN1841_c0_g1_i2.p1 TRINITY_DN1841_c0_g1~~TRINITY_DN1841_c0_g1_i2.p1  ORF type:complete len:191 (-),score=41.30 TRINITY_DN1841_c0_g1_i2:479-1051(-)
MVVSTSGQVSPLLQKSRNNTKGATTPNALSPQTSGQYAADFVTQIQTPYIDDNGFHPVWRGMKRSKKETKMYEKSVAAAEAPFSPPSHAAASGTLTKEDSTASSISSTMRMALRNVKDDPCAGTFKVPVWQMSTLVLQAWDKDDVDADDFLAEVFVPLPLLKQGIRRFPLQDIHSKPIPGAFLMCEISFQ